MAETTRCYDKPIWTLSALALALPDVPRQLIKVTPTLFNRTLTSALRERIMLAVAAENRCWYCQTAHNAFGRAAGLGASEIADILDGHDPDLDPAEQLAVRFARDLAHRDFASRDEGLLSQLRQYFTDQQCEAIEAAARLMNLANRFGNTFDLARSRLRHRCVAARVAWPDLLVISGIFVAAALAVTPLVGALALSQRGRG